MESVWIGFGNVIGILLLWWRKFALMVKSKRFSPLGRLFENLMMTQSGAKAALAVSFLARVAHSTPGETPKVAIPCGLFRPFHCRLDSTIAQTGQRYVALQNPALPIGASLVSLHQSAHNPLHMDFPPSSIRTIPTASSCMLCPASLIAPNTQVQTVR
jgi:hypothetical protein